MRCQLQRIASILFTTLAVMALSVWSAAALSPEEILASYPPMKISQDSDHSLNLQGGINKGDAVQILRNISSSIKTLNVSLTGGNSEEAMTIGKIIKRFGLEVRVVGLCASGCAQYLLPAASKAIVEPDGLVLFHHYPAGLFAIAQMKGFVPEPRELELGQKDSIYNADLGINPDIFLRAHLELGTVCISQVGETKKTLIYKSRNSGWLPKKEYLTKVGINLFGAWPDTLDQFVLLLKEYQIGVKTMVGYSFEPTILPKEITDQAIEKLTRC
jgi:hypothetical protein